jgi:hypothetical protein
MLRIPVSWRLTIDQQLIINGSLRSGISATEDGWFCLETGNTPRIYTKASYCNFGLYNRKSVQFEYSHSVQISLQTTKNKSTADSMNLEAPLEIIPKNDIIRPCKTE